MIQDNLKQRLLVLRGTLRNACLMDGMARLIATLVACALAAVLLDYFFFRWDKPINTFFRVAMLVGMLGTVGYLLYRRIFVPLSVPLSVDDMALAVEKEFPQLSDSLISTMQLTRALADDKTVSAAMVEEVSRSAYQQTAALDFKNVVKFERIRPVLIGAASAVALVLILGITPLRPYLATGFVRLINPFAKTAYPVRTFIDVQWTRNEKNERIVPRQDAVDIVAVVKGDLPSVAYIQFDHGKGMGKLEPISEGRTRTDPESGEKIKEFTYQYNPVVSNFAFKVEAGDNQTHQYAVRVVDRPEATALGVQYELPQYISEQKSDWKRERSLRNVIGTKATLKGETNKPLKAARMVVGNGAPVDLDLSPDRKMFLATVLMDETKDYEISLLDDDGLDNTQNRIRHKIFVLPDNLPKIAWRAPAMDLEVSPTANVALAMGLDDDYGLQKALIKFRRFKAVKAVEPEQAVVGARNAAPQVATAASPSAEGGFDLPEPIPGAFNKSAQKLDISKDWSLAEMGLEPGDVVEYWAEAYDWCPTPRKGGEAQVYRLRILSAEEIRRKLDIERLRLIEDLKVIIRDQEVDKKHVDTLADHLKIGNPFEHRERTRVSEAGALQEEVRRKTLALQNAFDALIARYVANGLDTPDDRDRLTQVRNVLETEQVKKMPDASKSISATGLAKADEERLGHLGTASKKQEEIIADLKELLDQMQKWAETEELLRMTRELLLKQRAVTKLTDETKDRLGVKKVAESSKEEQGQVKALEHEQRDCATDMKTLFDRMLQALAKMQLLDKWVAKNIEDSIAIAQNTDATPENPNLATTGDPFPSIEDKMRSAQEHIRGKEVFEFGMAGGKQRSSEVALERIITVLTRRRDIDKDLLKDIDKAKRDLQKILDKQKELTRQTKDIMNKADLQKTIAEAQKQMKDIRDRQEKLKNETENLQKNGDPKADQLAAGLDQAHKDIENLIKEQEEIFKKTADQLSDAEKEIARAVLELEAIEKDELDQAKIAAQLGDGSIEKTLRERHAAVKALAAKQDDLKTKAAAAQDGGVALKEPQTTTATEIGTESASLATAARELQKNFAKESPLFALAQDAAKALTAAEAAIKSAPDAAKDAAAKLAESKGKDAVAAQTTVSEALHNAEEILLKALGAEQKNFEDKSLALSDKQQETRTKLDDLNNRLANVVRAGNTPEKTKDDPKLAEAGKNVAQVLPQLEAASKETGDASEASRNAAPRGERQTTARTGEMQKSAADKIAKARAALSNASKALAGDKKAEMGETSGQQTAAQVRAQQLADKIGQLAKDINQAHAAAGGKPDAAQPKDAKGASEKVGDAGKKMGEAANDLKTPDPANAAKNSLSAVDDLEDAKNRLNDLKKKVEELQTPARRLERTQKGLKDETRDLADKIKGVQQQMDNKPADKNASESAKNASNNMQNAQNELGQNAQSGKKGGDQQSGKPGESGGKPGDQKSGDQKSGEESKKDAVKEQDKALSELDKALAALEELAGKAAKEENPREAKALKKLEEPQKVLRDEVLKLQNKLDQMKDKTGNKSAEKASKSSQSAGQKQSKASSQMSQGDQGGAQKSEEEAEKDLQDALDNLENLQQQMEQQSKNEQLFQIEQELKKMLAVQKDVLNKTQEIEKQRPGADQPLPRRAKLMVKQVFSEQLQLSDSTKAIVKKLEDAPVFQWVMTTAQSDMNEAAARLDKEDSGALTQEIQEDVIRKLGDLIEALRKERTKPQQQQQGGGGGGGGGKQPLVPPLAELKMLMIMQKQVNVQTKKIDDDVSKARKEGKTDLTKDQRDKLRRAAVKEGEISRITNKIADELGSGGQGAQPVPGAPEKDDDGN